jgi:hypothetical protein
MTSVQAALNVFISVLGTIGIWSFSGYWWRRGRKRMLRKEDEVPLPFLCTIPGPGEAWDVVEVLRERLFHKKNWHLLFQIAVIVTVTMVCVLSGPIARAAPRSNRTVVKDRLQVLQSSAVDGVTSDILEAKELWNETIYSLDKAGFPENMLLDYLPPSEAP